MGSKQSKKQQQQSPGVMPPALSTPAAPAVPATGGIGAASSAQSRGGAKQHTSRRRAKQKKTKSKKVKARRPDDPDTVRGLDSLRFEAHSGKLDFSQITEWERVYAPDDYNASTICPIALEPLGEGHSVPVVRLSCHSEAMPCIFQLNIIERCLLSAPVCPSCSHRFVIPGPQPTGSMSVRRHPPSGGVSISGYSGAGAITIRYNFPSGTQAPQHPKPGKSYAGTSRTVYLPDVPEGNEALQLLKRAFMRGLLFRVGQSVTTGRDDQTVWAGIHQKTNTSGGTSSHGWPDSGYFDRLKQECAAQGLFSEEYEAAAAKAHEEWRIARQRSQEEKEQKVAQEGSGDDAQQDPAQEDTTANTKVPTPAADTGDVQALKDRLSKLNADISAAMRSQNREMLRNLMQERNQLSSKLAQLTK